MSIFSWENLIFNRGHNLNTIVEGLIWRSLHSARAPHLYGAELRQAAYIEGGKDYAKFQIEYDDGKGESMTKFITLALTLTECPDDWDATRMEPKE